MKYKVVEQKIYNARLNQWQTNTYLEPEEEPISEIRIDENILKEIFEPKMTMNDLIKACMENLNKEGDNNE